MFMLVMQFLWKYIDDLMGKGLDLLVIIELLFYVSASLLPLALPLAVLLSSLIVMGNLGEYNELTALKASGMSIYRIVKPLAIFMVIIAVGTFYFSNYVIPVANYKWRSIIWDIQETKLAAFLKPGSYTQDIDGFSIKISEGKDNDFKRIIIHDKRDLNALKTITANSGEFYRSESGEFLFFKLNEGEVLEELSQSPSFTTVNDDQKKVKQNKTYPGRKSSFKTATYKMNLSGFELNRSQDDLFKDGFEMLNVFQIDKTVDSLRSNFNEVALNFSENTKTKHEYFQAIHYQPLKLTDHLKKDSLLLLENPVKPDTLKKEEIIPVFTIDSISGPREWEALSQLINQIKLNINSLDSQLKVEKNKKVNLKKFEIEFHRKFSLSFSIIILFFIGAPLGAIVKKGGFGAPVVIAALLFMVYFVLISIGDNMAKENVLTPFMGMWGPNFILLPFAFILMMSAANDRSVTDFFFFKRLFSKKNKS